MALAGAIEFKFTPATAGTAGTVTIEQTAPAAAIWAAQTTGGAGVTTCACTSTGGDQTCTGSVDSTKKILTVTLASGKTLAAGVVATITCSTNLADLGAAGTAVVFKAKTSEDDTDKADCSG